MAEHPTTRHRPNSGPAAAGHPLPELVRHTKLDPDDGVCLMEYVALLSGQRITDAPRGVHPLLAAVARGVNDTLSDSARPALTHLATDLVGLYPRSRSATLALVRVVLTHGLSASPRSWALRRHRRLAAWASGLPDRWWTRPVTVLYVRGPARHAAEYTIRTLGSTSDADARLIALLTDAVATLRTVPSGQLPGGWPATTRDSAAPSERSIPCAC